MLHIYHLFSVNTMHKFVSAAKQENICFLHQKFCARPKILREPGSRAYAILHVWSYITILNVKLPIDRINEIYVESYWNFISNKAPDRDPSLLTRDPTHNLVLIWSLFVYGESFHWNNDVVSYSKDVHAVRLNGDTDELMIDVSMREKRTETHEFFLCKFSSFCSGTFL